MDHLRSGVQDQPDQHEETPISTKNKKFLEGPMHEAGESLESEQELAVNRDHATALQPG